MLIVRPVWSTQAPHLPVTQWQWVRSRNGVSADAHGSDAPALLPRDNDVVLLVPAHQVSWHAVQLPRVPQHRLRQALHGLLEEQVLVDPAELHLALPQTPEWGQPLWVAAVRKDLLRTWLAVLQAAQRPVARIVPELTPSATPQVQAWMESDEAWVGLSSALGVVCWPLPRGDVLAGGVAGWLRALAHDHDHDQGSNAAASTTLWASWQRYSEPPCLAQVETALGTGVTLEMPSDRWLRVAQSSWDLAQFDLKLSAQARRSQRLHQVWRHVLHSRPWRAARWGVVALALSAVSVVAGWTWQEQHLLSAKRQRIQQTLTDVFPHVTLVLDAPVQMARELSALQRRRGQLGQGDVEVLLHDLGSSVPAEALIGIESNSSSTTQLRFASGADAVAQAAAQVLQQRGWQVQVSGATLEARRAASALASNP
uniref:General secretion pathway protein L n=1 Tax=uncultured bacterium A1Q1_fos_500 TaxID=1256579 RepID=L7VWT3_9BACT|nr:general secretion pathway protein L [uncultured bacterium A1Q1_fos_500]